ncbi:L-iditol 2-dehydrogenase [Lipingzhangella halophila]|uniref:L-iditol 2-dehydrogenase n=1 Tax=Lipingzhangella halophila TaxID=1783352 RepID=A0A7W7W563_9ACTN|nr:alcohol dehydrogenase catalytic domain-containing protein [Lipingzhangella halophila]MBB4934456.1 L-iditol 2-dehydrogenase [Lipingzhangella halophila]
MTGTMRAAVLYGAEDLRIDERPVPRPEAGEALVAVETVGLCGSDLHYYLDGRNGTNQVRGPVVLGHEVGGRVADLGPGAPEDLAGARVVVEPAVPCRTCAACVSGRYNLCPHTACLGSPPTDGGLAEYLRVPAVQLHRVPDDLPRRAVPLLEPLAVAVHALRRAAFVPGQSVLVTGAGPIGLLVAQVARSWGAAEVTVSDIDADRLTAARALGVSRTATPAELDGLRVARSLECSGAPAALPGLLAATEPGGRAVLVGTLQGGEVPAPLGLVQRYEIDLVGTFRYAAGFPPAVDLVRRGAVDLTALVTAGFSLDEADRAFRHAAGGAGLKTTIDCTRRGNRS